MLLRHELYGLSPLISPLIALYMLFYLYQRLCSRHGLPPAIPWVGTNGGAWSRMRATKRSFFGLREMIMEGYNMVSTRELLESTDADSVLVFKAGQSLHPP